MKRPWCRKNILGVKKCDAICIEDLDLKGIAQSLHIGKSANDNGFNMLREFLQYKLEEYAT